MKKIILLILTILLFIPLNVQAESFSAKDLTVSIDDNWDVFTRDNIKDNKRLEELGITYEYINNVMNKNYIYIDACKFDEEDNANTIELFVIIKPVSGVKNLHTYSSSDIKDLGEEVKKKVNADEYEVYSKDKYKYIFMNYYDKNVKYNITEYYTVMNGYGYSILAQKTNEFTDDEINDVRKIVDTIKYKYNAKYETKSSSSNIWLKTLIGALIGGMAGGIGVLVNKLKNKNNKEN